MIINFLDIICCLWNFKNTGLSSGINKLYEFDIIIKINNAIIKMEDEGKSIIIKMIYNKKKKNEESDNFIHKIKIKLN